MTHRHPAFFFCLLLFLSCCIESLSQGKLYTAKGYWEESTKKEYQMLKDKVAKGDSLTTNEKSYIEDYDVYLSTYFQRLPEEEKQNYARLKATWDRGLTQPIVAESEYEWRGRDRWRNAFYGLYYGGSLVAVSGSHDATAAGIPLIVGGLWVLGPVINPKKYDGLTQSMVRASNTGKLLGLGYGAALGLAVGGNTSDDSKWILGLSSAGSIALGEIGFQMQKRKKFSPGQIEMIRHYGFLGPLVGLAGAISTGSSDKNLIGTSLLVGGISGMIIGNQVAKKYDYTRGDVDAISCLTLISTGIGFTAIAGALEGHTSDNGLILIPAVTSIAGTIWGQRSVRGLHLTDKQGSKINLATAGAALIGVGIVTLAEPNSLAVGVGVPTGLALITHQLLLHNFRMKNLEVNLRGSTRTRNNFKLAVQVTPESYFLNQKISPKEYSPSSYSALQNPVVRIKLTF